MAVDLFVSFSFTVTVCFSQASKVIEKCFYELTDCCFKVFVCILFVSIVWRMALLVSVVSNEQGVL